MKQIPSTQNTLVLRTDFSDDSAWQQICTGLEQRVGDFKAYVEFVSDPAFDGLTAGQFVNAPGVNANRSFAFLVDGVAFSDPEHAIFVVDLYDDPGRTFRVIPAATGEVENNLSLGNMDFEEFADSADEDGVFRGFTRE